MSSTYFPEGTGGGGITCEPPMTRTELIALRNASGLSKDCHYVINDYTRVTTVGDAQILLHAVDVNVLSQTAMFDTIHDNTAWDGRYDIDTNRITELRDDIENIVIGEDTVDAFPWGNANVTRNYVSESTLNYVTTDGTFSSNQISGPVIVDAQGASFVQNTVSGSSQATTSGNATCANNLFTGQTNVTFISGNNSDNEFRNDSIYNQVGTGTINLSTVGGAGNVVTNGNTLLSQCNLFSTAFNTTGSSGSIIGTDFRRCIITLNDVVAPIDFDDNNFYDANIDAANAQQIQFISCNADGDADIDIGPGALLFATRSTIENEGTLNVIAGRLTYNGSTISSQGTVSVNSTSLVGNILSDSIVQTGGVLQYLANSENCDVDRSIIQNEALVRFDTGAINSQLLTTTVDEVQLTVTGSGDIRHSRLAGSVTIANQNMVLTNVQSEIATLNLLGSEGSMANATFERNIVTITNCPDVDIDQLSMSSLASIAAVSPTRLDLTNVNVSSNSVIDIEPNTILDADDCSFSDGSLVDVNAGHLRLLRVVCSNGTIQNTPANALQNVISDCFLASSGLMRFTGTVDDCDITFSSATNAGVITITGTSVGAQVDRSSTEGRVTNGREIIITNSDNALIRGTSVMGDSVARIEGSDGGRILECNIVSFSTIRILNNTGAVTANRCSVENGALLTLTNTAVVAGVLESKFMNSFIAQFNFTVAGNSSYMFGYGNGASVIADPPDGVVVQNF